MDDFSTWSVRALKAELQARAVQYGDCTEKSELVERLRTAAAQRPAEAPAATSPPRPAAAAPPQSKEDAIPEAAEVRRVLQCAPGEYYRILQVPTDADADALKRAYRKLAIKLHPDKCHARGADEAFKRVGQAYAVLSDPRKRTSHDWGGGDASGATGVRQRGPGFGDQDAEELFRAFFGGGDFCGDSGRRSASGASGANVAPASTQELAERAAGLFARLGKTFARNPWTFVTLLSGLASLVSFLETVTTLLGGWMVAVVPLMAMGLYACPPDQRRNLGLLAAVLLCSGLLF